MTKKEKRQVDRIYDEAYAIFNKFLSVKNYKFGTTLEIKTNVGDETFYTDNYTVHAEWSHLTPVLDKHIDDLMNFMDINLKDVNFDYTISY